MLDIINDDKRANGNASIDDEFIEPIIALNIDTSLGNL